MKVKDGLVANSSTMSFMLRLPNYPEDAKEVQRWLFPDGEDEVTRTNWNKREVKIDTLGLSTRVFRDIQEAHAGPSPLEKLAEAHRTAVPQPIDVTLDYEDNDHFYSNLMQSNFENYVRSSHRDG
jgi:hypothetical protein